MHHYIREYFLVINFSMNLEHSFSCSSKGGWSILTASKCLEPSYNVPLLRTCLHRRVVRNACRFSRHVSASMYVPHLSTLLARHVHAYVSPLLCKLLKTDRKYSHSHRGANKSRDGFKHFKDCEMFHTLILKWSKLKQCRSKQTLGACACIIYVKLKVKVLRSCIYTCEVNQILATWNGVFLAHPFSLSHTHVQGSTLFHTGSR